MDQITDITLVMVSAPNYVAGPPHTTTDKVLWNIMSVILHARQIPTADRAWKSWASVPGRRSSSGPRTLSATRQALNDGCSIAQWQQSAIKSIIQLDASNELEFRHLIRVTGLLIVSEGRQYMHFKSNMQCIRYSGGLRWRHATVRPVRSRSPIETSSRTSTRTPMFVEWSSSSSCQRIKERNK